MSIAERLNSATAKACAVALLALLMLIPLAQVRSLVAQRQELQQEAQARIAAGIGGVQRLGGPVLSLPAETLQTIVDETTHAKNEKWVAAPALRILPRVLTTDVELKMELRRKGIYALPTYVASIHIRGEFDRATILAMMDASRDSDAGHAPLRHFPQRTQVLLSLGELKSLRSASRLDVAGVKLQAAPGSLADMQVLAMPIDLTALLDTQHGPALPFSFDVEVSGSDAITFIPLAAETTVRVHSSWPHPDYQGAFLPVEKSSSNQGGFSARWSVLQLNRAIPQVWSGDTQGEAQFAAATFGVRLMQASTVYSSNERAVRYGILFIAITFLGFFGWEHVSGGLRLHAMQYILVGLALAVFYLLLLALSEHLGFAAAYTCAATALVVLIAVYVAGATGRRAAAAVIAALLALSYGLLYLILQSEDFALLLGSLLVFATLATVMLATRRLDWSTVGNTQQ